MQKIALRFGYHKYWNNLYYSPYFLDKSYPIPGWSHLKQDNHLMHILNGHKIEIHKYRDTLSVYITFDKFYSFDITKILKRTLYNLYKCKIKINKIYTFPIDDVNTVVGLLLKDAAFDASKALDKFKKLWVNGKIEGVKLKIKGRYKKSTRTQSEVYQFGKIPNTPTTNLNLPLFYSSYQLLQSLGTSSIHLYISYGTHD